MRSERAVGPHLEQQRRAVAPHFGKAEREMLNRRHRQWSYRERKCHIRRFRALEMVAPRLTMQVYGPVIWRWHDPDRIGPGGNGLIVQPNGFADAQRCGPVRA